MSDVSDSFELAMKIDSTPNFGGLHYWDEDGLQVSQMIIRADDDSKQEERFRVEKHADGKYSIGQIENFGIDEGGESSYDVRNAYVFMQEMGIKSDLPVDSNQRMIGPLRAIDALRIPKLVYAHLNNEDEICAELRSVFENGWGGYCDKAEAAAKAQLEGPVQAQSLQVQGEEQETLTVKKDTKLGAPVADVNSGEDNVIYANFGAPAAP